MVISLIDKGDMTLTNDKRDSFLTDPKAKGDRIMYALAFDLGLKAAQRGEENCPYNQSPSCKAGWQDGNDWLKSL